MAPPPLQPARLLPVLLSLLLAPPLAAGTSSGWVFLGTGNPWRALALNQTTATLGGGLEHRSDDGFFLAVSGSTVEFVGGPGADPSFELQLNGGKAWDLGPGQELRLGVITSRYPGAAVLDYDEPYLAYDRGRWSLLASYSPNYFGAESWSWHAALTRRFPLAPGWSADATVATFQFEDRASAGLRDYDYWVVGLERALGKASVRLQYQDASHSVLGFFVSHLNLAVTLSF